MKKLLILLSLLLITACSVVSPAPEKDLANITVSVPAQAWLAKAIGGEFVSVQSMVQAGDDPHSYEPTPAQMKALAETDLYFTIGVEYEAAWLPRLTASNRNMRVVDTAEGVALLEAEAHAHETEHANEPEDHYEVEHHHDPHIWFSPKRMKQVAHNMAAALIHFNPVNKEAYEQNLDAVLKQLDEVDESIALEMSKLSQRKFLIMHPLLAYFAADYGLEQIAVEIGGQEPSPAELAALLDLAKKNQIHALFIQQNTHLKMADSIAASLGIKKTYELDPLAENWPQSILQVSHDLAEGLSE